jgi:mRNA interferase MazF
VSRQGEVHDLGGARRVVVLSSDHTTEEAGPIVAPIVRGSQEHLPYLVALRETDPMAGSVEVAQLRAIGRERLGAPVALITGASMRRLVDAVQQLFEL